MTRVAVTVPQMMGDGVILAYFCHNLARQGLEVTIYHSLLAKAADWFPSITVKKLPARSDAFNEWSQFDAIIAFEAPSTDYLFPPEFFNQFEDKLIRLALDDVHVLLTRQFTCKNEFSHPALKALATLNGTCIQASNPSDEPLNNRQLVDLLLQQINITNPDSQVLKNPSSFHVPKKNNRVVMQVSSSFFRKDWSLHKFSLLSRMLVSHGFEPVWMLEPNSRSRYNTHVKQRFLALELDMPGLFATIESARYCISVDTGPAHVASLLGLFTATVLPTHRAAISFWRPSFAPNVIISPSMKIPALFCSTHRRSLLTPKQVFKKFLEFHEQCEKSALSDSGGCKESLCVQ